MPGNTEFSGISGFKRCIIDCALEKHSRKGMKIMSEKERAIQLLDRVPEYKMGYVLAYIQGITADEDADDRFCERMIQDYNNSPDEDKEDITLEECKKEWGLD